MKRFPFVTIAIPAFNEEEAIERTIKSALELDYPKEKIEILVMNHSSTDNTKKIAEEVIEKSNHPNIRLINVKRTPGKLKAEPMNIALNEAKGEFFVCFDADSVTQKNALKKILPYYSRGHLGLW